MTTRMKAAVVPEANAPWELQDIDQPEVGPDQVLVRIHACGICGTDAWMAQGALSFREFPLVLGHEGVGEVVAVGEGVTARKPGDRVGMPIVQKACGVCDFCRGQHVKSFVTASNCADPTLTGVNVDGAHAEYLAADAGGTVLLPDEVSYELAAPTLCSGAFDEMTLPALPLVSHSRQVIGSAHNGMEYLVEALDFVARGEVEPMVELFPEERVAEAYDRVASGEVRFKAVVTY